MRLSMHFASALVLAGIVASASGCGQSPAARNNAADTRGTPPETAEYDVKVASAEAKIAPQGDDAADAAALVVPADPQKSPTSDGVLPLDDAPTELTMPKVFLTQAHADTCLVKVGDAFPELRLANLGGEPQSLDKLRGEKLTVVVFWNGKRPTALDELADLNPCVVQRFPGKGVAVVGVNSGDDPQLASELTKKAEATFVNLSDRDGKALAQVATAKLPRTYLLDASGKVIWFDLEYSRTTRRELVQAIRFQLAKK